MPFWRSLHGRLTRDIGIDLGTRQYRHLCARQRNQAQRALGRCLQSPHPFGHRTGFSAKQMIGRAPLDVLVVRPLSDGVIGDIDKRRDHAEGLLNRAVRRSDRLVPA